ncbi:hypothetical protein F2Q68_00028316 [Brassica cretica]|uniref:BHLH domain-containing protein n=2 Tax=Brassica cretica TaxID=69181 RepID=A0ABQ7DET7_BRACR|nr:hypothetical protein F2Q68_00028316 [Brassica cretica]KAF3575961.1 hypothetical protein DY000_02035888 [Brassica cretica]
MASAYNPIYTDVPEKDVFALHFLQTLSNLRTQNSFSSPDNKTSDRVKKIKKAARKRRVTWLMRRRSNRGDPIEDVAAERLRNLVPGGGGMETSKLMEETAHYIKCLSMHHQTDSNSDFVIKSETESYTRVRLDGDGGS